MPRLLSVLPQLAGGRYGHLGYFSAGSCFYACNLWVLFIFLPVTLPSKIQKLPPGPPVRGFPGVWKLPLLRLPSRDGSPSLALLSLFIFYILSDLLLKTVGCFSGRLMSSASDQKLFCKVCSALNSFDKFVGEKVVSPSCSSAILAPPWQQT